MTNATSFKLIVGLGNPGAQYERSRHNVGFRVLDLFVTSLGSTHKWEQNQKFNAQIVKTTIGVSTVIFMKPQTFMNSSGSSVMALSAYYSIPSPNILIIHDDMDIALGQSKLQQSRGSAGHHGVESIIQKLGSNEFFRLRVGIDGNVVNAKDFVLQNFTEQEETILNSAMVEVIQTIKNWIEVA